jgi:hypothetical protein
VSVTDVVRAAFGEVEDYQRVALREIEPAMVVGLVTADLAHLVAELVENALTFSPPQWAVEIAGRRLDDGGYRLAIIDAGEGMTPEVLAQANRRLAGEESFTVAPSKYLGHYVAGNLAARHGIRVRLDRGPSGHGTIATIDLPRAMLTDEAPAGAGGNSATVAPTPLAAGPGHAATRPGAGGWLAAVPPAPPHAAHSTGGSAPVSAGAPGPGRAPMTGAAPAHAPSPTAAFPGADPVPGGAPVALPGSVVDGFWGPPGR